MKALRVFAAPTILHLVFGSVLGIAWRPSIADGFEVGLEAGAVVAWSNHAYGSPANPDAAFGFIVAHTFRFESGLNLTPWIDAQTPFNIYLQNQSVEPSYWPIDGGLRFGSSFGAFDPYAGFVAQLLILNNSNRSQGGVLPSDTIFAFGGDVGVDYSAGAIALGIEVRLVTTLTGLTQSLLGDYPNFPATSVLEMGTLLSARLRL
jgi:hypothetical protein